MYVYGYVHVCASMWAHRYTCGSLRLISGVLLYHCPPYFKQHFSLDWKLAFVMWTRLAGQWALGTFLSPPCQHWSSRHKVDSGDQHSGPRACTRSTSVTLWTIYFGPVAVFSLVVSLMKVSYGSETEPSSLDLQGKHFTTKLCLCVNYSVSVSDIVPLV